MKVADGALALAIALATVCLAQSGSVSSPIVAKLAGRWVEDESKSKAGASEELVFRRTASGGLEELRGDKNNPVVQEMNFDGRPYTIPGGNMIAWKQIDKNTFQREIFDGRTTPGKLGRLLTRRKLQISGDGKTLTEQTERMESGGKSDVVTAMLRRTSGPAQGLEGIWQVQSFRSSSPAEVVVEARGNRLKFSTSTGSTYTVALDGKPVPVAGPTVFANTTVAAKQIDDHTVELTRSREGAAGFMEKLVLSADGKTLTVTDAPVAHDAANQPSIEVYRKQ